MSGQESLVRGASVLLLGAGCGAGGATLMLWRARRGLGRIDMPDDRRLHTVPTPRGGGVGFVPAAIVACLLMLGAASSAAEARLSVVLVFVWALPNAIVGIVDDHTDLTWRSKLVVQMVSATAAVWGGLRLPPEFFPGLGTFGIVLGAGLSVLWLVWMMNLFNFMDGMDALAAPSAAFFFAAFALVGYRIGLPLFSLVALAMAAASLGFLPFNAPPARIFMGDGGSLFIGAILGGLVLSTQVLRSDQTLIPATLLILAPFLVDTGFTLVRRILRGESPVRAHRTHLYQRLLAAGWTGRGVRVLYTVVTLSCAGAAFAFISMQGAARVLPVTAGVAACAVIIVMTTLAERRVGRAAVAPNVPPGVIK